MITTLTHRVIHMIAKPGKKVSKTSLKKKADTLASRFYRAETPFCELAGKDSIHCGGNLQWMHIFSRSNLRLRYEPYNKLVGCQGHHVWYTHNPVEWVRFLETHFPERLSEAELHRNELAKLDYNEVISRFKD